MNATNPSNLSFPRRVMASTWSAGAIYVTLTLASTVNGDGLRSFHPSFATRLPLQWIAPMVGLRRIDLATVVAAMVVGASYYCLDRTLRDYLLVRLPSYRDMQAARNRTVFRLIAAALLVLDASFFFVGLLRPNGWTPLSAVGVGLLTALYLSLMFAMAYLNITLWLKPERN